MRKLAVIALLLTVAAGAYYYWYGPKLPFMTAQPAQTPEALAGRPVAPQGPVSVEAAKVEVGRIAREITAIGTLRSSESVVIRPEIAGRIASFAFTEGQPVHKGQQMVKLDDAIQRAALQEANANLALAQANAERARTLFRQGAGTERNRDETEAQLRVAQAKVETAKAQLEKTLISAPFDGVAGLRTVSVGAYVNPGQDIVNIESLQPIEVDFRVPEVFLAAVKTGQTLSMQADAFPGRSFPAQVEAIDPLIDQNGRSILIRARADNSAGDLRPGLFVRVTLIVDEVTDALLIPEGAVVPRGTEFQVYKVVDGKAELIGVKLGKRRAGKVEVVEGLTRDDVVVTAGHMKLRPGSAVAVVGGKQGV